MHALQPNSFGLCQPPSADDSFGNTPQPCRIVATATWVAATAYLRHSGRASRACSPTFGPSTRAISIRGLGERKSRPLARFYPLTHALDLFDLNQERARRTGADERFRQCAKGRISSPNNSTGLVPLHDVFSGTVAHSHNVGGYPPSKPEAFFRTSQIKGG